MGSTRYLGNTKAAAHAEARRSLNKSVRLNQRGCWPVRNLTNRKWWQRPYREPEKWAMAQVHDLHAGEEVRDILFSPDGRIGVVCRRKGDVIYVREVLSPCAYWNVTETRKKLAEKLPDQSAAACFPAWSSQPEPKPGPLLAHCVKY